MYFETNYVSIIVQITLIDYLEACHWYRGRGRPRATFVDNLLIDTGVENTSELETLMLDRMVWR